MSPIVATPAESADAPSATPAPRAVPPLGPAWLLPAHTLAAILIQSSANAAWFMLPYLALRHFGASEWETLIITAAPNVMFVFSVFWQHASMRLSPLVYLLIIWAAAYLPWGLIGLTTSFWPMAVLHVIACWGGAAYWPLSGALFKRFYADHRHGRAFGLISAATLAGGAAAAYAAGQVLSADPLNYRWLLPAAAGLQLLGVLLLAWLDHLMRHTRPPPAPRVPGGLWSMAVQPVLNLRQVLRADRLFFRYEAAYMTYGAGWMISYALVPLIGNARFGLGYDTYPLFAVIPFQIASLLLAMPCGWLGDRIGPVRVSVLAFGLFATFPLGLMLSAEPEHLALTCFSWGVCAAGVNVGWLLGPVALAPSSDKVSHYVAIHATMVGLRGTLFQFAGVALLKLTGSFAAPLALAALGFVWAAWQMWALRGEFARRLAGRTPGA